MVHKNLWGSTFMRNHQKRTKEKKVNFPKPLLSVSFFRPFLSLLSTTIYMKNNTLTFRCSLSILIKAKKNLLLNLWHFLTCPRPAKLRSFQGPFSGLCYSTNALPAVDFHSTQGFWRLQRHTREVRHQRSWWCSLQQVVPSAGNRHAWRSKQVALPATPEDRHMSSLLWETICCPLISSTCCLDSHLSSAPSSLDTSAPSLRCRSSILWYWTHCVCQCWSTRRISYAYQFLFVLR